MLDRLNRHRISPIAGAIVTVAAIAVATAGAASASTRPAGTHAAARTVKPTPPAVVPRHGRPFIPVQGDWEGTAGGFDASFNLVLDAGRQQRAGVPQYGIQDLVMLRPRVCPVDPAQYRESIISGRLPSVLGDHGDLGLRRFSLQGAFTGQRAATLAGPYSLPSCHGTLTWRMHPAVRRTVATGSWTLRYAGVAPSTFHVQAGGRLATAIRLPASIAACNGLQGTLDVFIGTQGRASVTQSGVKLALRFANAKATGTLTASGCQRGPVRVTATHPPG